MVYISPTPIMKYIVQYTGEWTRNSNGDPIFKKGWTKTYTDLDNMELFFKHYFVEMISEQELVRHLGAYVFQRQK